MTAPVVVKVELDAQTWLRLSPEEGPRRALSCVLGFSRVLSLAEVCDLSEWVDILARLRTIRALGASATHIYAAKNSCGCELLVSRVEVVVRCCSGHGGAEEVVGRLVLKSIPSEGG